jgi:RNA polymerase-binding transcription factor DksA
MDSERARKRLDEERERLEKVRDGLLADPETRADGESIDELSSVDQHPGDIGTETFEHEKNQSLLEGVEGQLADIEAAYKRLENGTYGKSVLSGEPIPDDRLEAVPHARYTVEEQAEIERSAGLPGTTA